MILQSVLLLLHLLRGFAAGGIDAIVMAVIAVAFVVFALLAVVSAAAAHLVALGLVLVRLCALVARVCVRVLVLDFWHHQSEAALLHEEITSKHVSRPPAQEHPLSTASQMKSAPTQVHPLNAAHTLVNDKRAAGLRTGNMNTET